MNTISCSPEDLPSMDSIGIMLPLEEKYTPSPQVRLVRSLATSPLCERAVRSAEVGLIGTMTQVCEKLEALALISH